MNTPPATAGVREAEADEAEAEACGEIGVRRGGEMGGQCAAEEAAEKGAAGVAKAAAGAARARAGDAALCCATGAVRLLTKGAETSTFDLKDPDGHGTALLHATCGVVL